MEHYLQHIFVLNIFLVFIDATIGYYAAPSLALLADAAEDAADNAVRGIRSLLAVVVALYMFFNCSAFFNANHPLLLLVTGVVGVDIVAQLVLRFRMKRRKEQ